uniref:NAD-dependent epimerase/dehydratase domain-containing protein n=1 Tax=Vannella robusta TaxID=1487602 RepID=A0A7S4IW66_9EUKA|mmetsp:Transcript_9645/g.11934  ORF Transcript_9645/g.11934 Transcript_9645/m.11934 type:complete len:386 (+) Transcript_9645:3-1160(+)
MRRQCVFITGGNGFVGQALVNRFMQGGDYELMLLVRNEKRAQQIFGQYAGNPNLHLLCGALADVNNPEFFRKHEELLSQVSVVIHLAAEMDFYPKHDEYLYQVNVDGTDAILNLCERMIEYSGNLERVIYCSSTEVIGPSTRDNVRIPATEKTSNEPSYVYGKSKILAENLVRQFALENNKFSLILRPTGIYGPGDTFSIYELQKMIEYGLLFFIPGSGEAKLMYTHVDDVVEAFYVACNVPQESCTSETNSSTYIIAPDNALTYAEWIKYLSQLLGRAKPFLHLPFWIVKPSTSVLSLFMNIGKTKAFMYKAKTIDRMAEDRWYSNKKAKMELNYQPKYTLQEGLRQTVQYNLTRGIVKKRFLSPVLSCSILVAFTLLLFLYFK